MKTFAPAAMTAIEAGEAIVTGAVEILCDPPVRVWGGYGTLTIDSEDYLGLGDRGLAQRTSAALGGTAQGMALSLSGIEAAALELLDADEIRGAATVVRRLIFGADGKTLLDAQVFDRGRSDTVETDEVIGGKAAIKVAVESAARGLGRSGGRMRSDSDQRLVGAADGYFKNVSYAGEKMLYWGGKRPARAGTALSVFSFGSVAGSTGVGGGGGSAGGSFGGFMVNS